MPTVLIVPDSKKSPWCHKAIMVKEPKSRLTGSPRIGYAHADRSGLPLGLSVLLRYLSYKKARACSLCGKSRKFFWTMIVNFRAFDVEHDDALQFSLDPSRGPVFAAFSPMCRGHVLCGDPPVMDALELSMRWFMDHTLRGLHQQGELLPLIAEFEKHDGTPKKKSAK